jgi:membrane fusion protein
MAANRRESRIASPVLACLDNGTPGAAARRGQEATGMAMRKERASNPAAAVTPLFRRQSLQSQREVLHGPVTAAMPPGAWAAAAFGFTSVLALALAGWLVEVPQRANAVGVLMPPDGFVRLVAPIAGRVTGLRAAEGQQVDSGQLLIAITADGESAGADSVAVAKRRSLIMERSLRREIAGKERQSMRRRVAEIDRQISLTTAQLGRAHREAGLHDGRNTLLARRLERLLALAGNGNVSEAELEEEQLALLQSRAATEAHHRQLTAIEQERDGLYRQRNALHDEEALVGMEQAIAREQLERQLADAEALVGRELRAPRAGIVARIMVRPGQAVKSGQTLATLYRDASGLEAWLYVPSASAGSLQAGQAVELQFDAYPHQVFGTQPAIIASVSAIALLPSEIDVPFAVPGPVFEVRARLVDEKTIEDGAVTDRRPWSLAAGTAVRAELVHERYRLYEWLLRLRRERSRAAADA